MLNFKQTAGLFKIAEKIICKKKKEHCRGSFAWLVCPHVWML